MVDFCVYMRQTYTQLQTTTKDYISQGSGSFTSSTVASFIQEHLNKKYQNILSYLDSWIVQDLPQTASTVADQQGYHYPPNTYPPIEAATLEIGSVDYPLTVVHSQFEWDRLNQISFSGSTIPQYIFPKRDHFELWPIPAAAGDTITLISNMQDRLMSVEDYTTGTVTVTNNDATVTHSATGFTAAMVGRWFKTDNDNTWYRIDTYTDTSNIELETVFEGTTGAAQTFIIGESPEIPPELHELLPHGVASDFYAGPRKDFQAAQAHNNYFWTGDYNNSSRDASNAVGGVLKAKVKYSRRSNSQIINRGVPQVNGLNERWSSTLSSTI